MKLIQETFLARVRKTYLKESDFKDLDTTSDYIKVYNSNTSFAPKDARFLGAIEFDRSEGYQLENYAFPFDKNNFTYPIKGETVVIIKFSDEYFYLPYTVTQYPNYREDYKTTQSSKPKETIIAELLTTAASALNMNYKNVAQTGIPNTSKAKIPIDNTISYNINEKIKFLKPAEGDTILSGRAGNTIRFSEFFLTPDGKSSSPGIFIRNKQKASADGQPIGSLTEENINEDGASIYLVSNSIKVPYRDVANVDKVAFSSYPSDSSGNQIYIHSDRITLSAAATSFAILSKGPAGVLTDDKFSVDAKGDVHLHSEANINLQLKGANKISLNSDSGKVYIGKDTGEGDAGANVQKMVLGGELVQLLSELLDACLQQWYLTPSGPTTTSAGPENRQAFSSLKSKLNTILSGTNFVSK